ncbi:2,5-didehydrogluconate reductase [Burkholderia sp. lig30]|jgi:2,5-diketo-D-gluconate reductase A|uniref:aldo/keto reductase family protein n=1 Tax=Burkholderia sp. lig30 TaxID=1192124 RepID=UPI000461C966|nr:aldo/keto reductase [Burkholderia sp. lig30]KDB09539.1 2,5-didehydrogluconate reductase [Burkholderia sp. lig30]
MTTSAHMFPLNAETAIPAVGFGTYLISPDDTAKAVSSAIACGYRHVDTAAVYDNEHGVGEGIRSGLDAAHLSREDIFVTTKLWPGYSGWGETPKSEAETIADFYDSLERLGLDYVDLYLIHSPHGGPQRIAQWRALVQLKQAGKARSIGVSNFNQKHLDEIKAAGLPLPEANQIELHPWSQKPELIAYMRENGIAPIAYSSLAPLSTWRVEDGQDSTKTAAMKRDGDVFAKMAAKYGVSEAQFLLRWGVQNGYAVLPKSLNPERMRQNLDIFGFSIDEKDMALLKTMDQGGGIAWGAIGDPTAAE